MQPDRWQSNQQVAGFYTRAIDDVGAVDCTDDEPCYVILAVGIKARHLGGLASYQSATGFLATRRNTFDYPGYSFGHHSSSGNVVQEKKRPRALNQNVVYAVTYEIAADGIVNA